jgi:predicted nucleic acid-binding protein
MTSIDTNVLISLWIQNAAENQVASAAMQKAARRGPLCVCGPVFSELLGLPGRTAHELRNLLEASGISIEWQLQEADWEAAGLAYQGYIRRRRSSGGELPRRMVTDLMIGAHAEVRGYTLLTLDLKTYRAAFPDLRIEFG